MDRVPVIALDGPGGSGKGTIAREVARQLGYPALSPFLQQTLPLRRGLHPQDALVGRIGNPAHQPLLLEVFHQA